MKVPFSWLTEYCDPGLTPQEIGDTLSMHSIELERISHLGVPDDEGFVVGRVLSAEPHPNADRLRVCEVDTGDGTRTIVCGAPNVAAGQTVAVVTPGARMPGGEKLKRAKLRGVESDGMILSERELETGRGSRRHHGPGRGNARDAALRGPAGRRARHRTRADVEPRRLLRRLRGRARAARGHRRAAGRAALGRRRRGDRRRRRRRLRLGGGRGPRAVPALHRPGCSPT